MTDESSGLPDDTPLERSLRGLINLCVGIDYGVRAEGPACDGSDWHVGELEESLRETVRLLRKFPAERRAWFSEAAAGSLTASR